MARSLTSATHNLRTTDVIAPASAGTVCFRIKPNWNSGDGGIHVFWQVTDRGTQFGELSFQKYSDNNIYVGWNGGGQGDQRIIISDTGIFSNGVFASHILTWDDAANDEKYYVDGAQKGSRTSALTTFAMSASRELTIGNYDSVDSQQNCDSVLSCFAYWDAVLSAQERASIDGGVSPLRVNAKNLKIFIPILGASPEPDYSAGTSDMTVSGTAIADNPPFAPFFGFDVFSPFSAPSGIEFAAMISCSWDVSGSLNTAIPFQAVCSASGDVAGALQTALQFSGGVSASGDVTGALNTSIDFSALVTASSQVFSDLSTVISFAALISSDADLTAEFSTGVAFAASVDASGDVSGDIQTAIEFAGLISGSGDVNASLIAPIEMAATIAASGDVSADAATQILLNASVQCGADATAALQTKIEFLASLLCEGDITADLTVALIAAAVFIDKFDAIMQIRDKSDAVMQFRDKLDSIL